MDRSITYTIPQEADGFAVARFLRSKGYSARNITELKHPEHRILLNGVPVYMTRTVQSGDTLTVEIHESEVSSRIVPVDLPLDILFEDEDILVISKPAGMPVHPSLNNYTNSLANGLAWYYAQQSKPFVFRCSNRLDRDTSGITVIAKHMVSAGILSEAIQRHEIEREYLAICAGHVTPASGRIEAPIGRRGNSSLIERQIDFEHGDYAATNYHVQEYLNGHTLVSLQLETGRTHQIRVHMQYLGYPLIGDYLYNPDMTHIQRQALHATRLSFVHPLSGEKLTFRAPLPADMQQVVDSLRLTAK